MRDFLISTYVLLNAVAVFSMLGHYSKREIRNKFKIILKPRGLELWRLIIIYLGLPALVIAALLYTILTWVPLKEKGKR